MEESGGEEKKKATRKRGRGKEVEQEKQEDGEVGRSRIRSCSGVE